MRFTGILLEDNQGREFVMMCLSPKNPLRKTFQLRRLAATETGTLSFHGGRVQRNHRKSTTRTEQYGLEVSQYNLVRILEYSAVGIADLLLRH